MYLNDQPLKSNFVCKLSLLFQLEHFFFLQIFYYNKALLFCWRLVGKTWAKVNIFFTCRAPRESLQMLCNNIFVIYQPLVACSMIFQHRAGQYHNTISILQYINYTILFSGYNDMVKCQCFRTPLLLHDWKLKSNFVLNVSFFWLNTSLKKKKVLS